MRDFIGVTHLPRIGTSLKREALILNRIGIYDYEKDIDLFQDQFDPYLRNELAWLLDQGIVFSVDDSYIDSLPKQWQGDPLLAPELIEAIQRGRTLLDQVEAATIKASGKEKLFDLMKQVLNARTDINEVFIRIVSMRLREIHGLDAFPLSYREHLPSMNQVVSEANVIRIVLNALPVPDDKTSWEQILEYRNDPDSFGKFLALRRWMGEVAKAKLPENEIEDKLEWLIHDYERHLKLHKLKAEMGAFETIVTVGSEFLENMVKANWGKAAKLLFHLKHRKVDLMEAEMKAPGSEVAYILKSREILE